MGAMQSSPRFRESVAWQKAMKLSASVYAVTKTFPKEETFGLTNQLRRASVSIPSNIAEGQGRLTSGEFAHFLGMARGSAMEVHTQLELALILGMGINSDIEKTQVLASEVLRILNAAISGVRKSADARKRQ